MNCTNRNTLGFSPILYYSLILCLLVCCFFVLGCKKINTPQGTPTCIEQKVRELSREKCPSVHHVYRYQFNSKTVYLFIPKTCASDLQGSIYDDNCNLLCNLGGISGNNTCENLDFNKFATNQVLIYENK